MKFGRNLLLAKFGSERVNEGFYTRKCMGVFAGRPKKSVLNNEVTVLTRSA